MLTFRSRPDFRERQGTIDLYLNYLKLRIFHFTKEIFSYHWKLCFGLILIWGLLVSGNEQIAIKKGFALLFSSHHLTMSTFALLICSYIFSFFVCLQVRTELHGGSVKSWIVSLPLAVGLQRLVEFFLLSLMLLPLTTTMLSSAQFVRGDGPLIFSKLSLEFVYFFTSYYGAMLFSLIAFLEKRIYFAFGFIGIIGLVSGYKGSSFLLACGGLQLFLTYHYLCSKSRASGVFFCNTSLFSKDFVKEKIEVTTPQVKLLLSSPNLLLFRLGFICSFYILLYLTISEIRSSSQKTYVFSVIVGIIGFITAGYMTHFFNSRRSKQYWINSLPKKSNFWFCQDLVLTCSVFLVLYIPVVIMFCVLGYITLHSCRRQGKSRFNRAP